MFAGAWRHTVRLMPAIDVEDLFKSYGRVDAARGISFRVEEGEVFALLGPNGAGKTTTLEILEGHRRRSGGRVGDDPAAVLISDVFQPIDNAPHWLRATASFFPLRPFADGLESAFNPEIGSKAVNWGHLGLLAAWGVGAAGFALLAFRWEPDGRRHGGRPSRRPATVSADRVRGLLQVRAQASRTRPAGEPREAARRRPARARRAVASSRLESIEGPAPTEDSSVPPDTLAPAPAGRYASPRRDRPDDQAVRRGTRAR